jgi:formate/nitrite transporter FocA (FNT family)
MYMMYMMYESDHEFHLIRLFIYLFIYSLFSHDVCNLGYSVLNC